MRWNTIPLVLRMSVGVYRDPSQGLAGTEGRWERPTHGSAQGRLDGFQAGTSCTATYEMKLRVYWCYYEEGVSSK